jgi:hypothetical protein
MQLEGGGRSFDFFFQAMAEHQVGNADAAQMYYAHAIQWMDAHDPRNPELLRFRAEAESLLGSEADPLFGGLMKPTVEGQPQNIGLLRARSSFFGRHGCWKEAAADLSQVVELDGSDDLDQFKFAILLLENGDVAGYRARCQKMVASFGASKDPGTLDKTAKASLLAAEAGFDPRAVCQLADQAVTLGKDGIWIAYFQLVKGLAEYRAGNFASAVGWVGKCIGQPGAVGGTAPSGTRDVAACAVLAMAQHRLQRPDEARDALAKAVELMNTKLPKLENHALGDNWIDWLIAHILLGEAQSLIPPPPH